jgi:hypothetical protein
MDWTAERVTELTDKWAAGHSAKQIGAMFHTSRSSVIGKIHRLGLPIPEKKLPVIANGLPRVRVYGGRTKVSKIREPKVQILRPWESEQLEVTELPEEQAAYAIAFIDTKSHHCRWPVKGDPADLVCCGSDVVRGFSWCVRHCRMAFRGAA